MITKAVSRLTRVTDEIAHIPKQQPLHPRQPLAFEMINADVINDIFRFYVACQPDGVFILTLVSTSWKNFVFQSPILWQWITIDSGSPDWIEKIQVCADLSRTYPLQVVLHLPVEDWNPVIALIARVQNIFVDIPDYMSGRDVTDATKALLGASEFPEACEIHWYRAGDALMKEDRTSILTPMSNVRSLNLEAEGSEFPNYHLYAKTRNIKYIESGDAYHPLVLLKIFNLLDILRNMPNLTTLVISSHSLDPISLDIDLPIVVLNELQDLSIHGIDSGRNGSLLPFVESIRYPNLRRLSMFGTVDDVGALIEYSGRAGAPIDLTVQFLGHQLRVVAAVLLFIPTTRTSVHVMVENSDLYIKNKEDIVQYIKSYISSLPRVAEIHLALISEQPARILNRIRALISSHWADVEACSIRLGPEGAPTSLLEYRKGISPAITIISGIALLVYDLASILGVIGGFYITNSKPPNMEDHTEFPAGVERVRFLSLRLTLTELADAEKCRTTVRDFSRYFRPAHPCDRDFCHYIVARFALPSFLDVAALALHQVLPIYVEAFTLDADSSHGTVSVSTSNNLHNPAIAANGVTSIVFTRYNNPYYIRHGTDFNFENNGQYYNFHHRSYQGSLRSAQSLRLETDAGISEVSLYRMQQLKSLIGSINGISRLYFKLPPYHKRQTSKPDVVRHLIPPETADYDSLETRYSFSQPPPSTSLVPPDIAFPERNSLKELSIQSNWSHKDKVALTGTLLSLTTLICPVGMLLFLLSQKSFPNLYTIQLYIPSSIDDIEGEMKHFDSAITSSIVKYRQNLPELRTLGLGWFPQWDTLCHMLCSQSLWIGNRSSLTLKLPALPSPSIQKGVSMALRGLEHSWESPPQWQKFKLTPRENNKGTCSFCFASGLDCKWPDYKGVSLISHCSRHSLVDLVVISKDTMV